MKQQFLADHFITLRARREAETGKRVNDGSFRATPTDMELYRVLSSEVDDKITPCVAILTRTCDLAAVIGETTLVLAMVIGMSSAPELIRAIRKEERFTDQCAGFTLGILRACVEVPDFLHMNETPKEMDALLNQVCYPWGGEHNADVREERLVIDRYLCEPSMDVSGTASALNGAARAFIRHADTSPQNTTYREIRFRMAWRALSTTRHLDNEGVPIAWVGQKILEPMLEECLRQMSFSYRTDAFLFAMDKLCEEAKSSQRATPSR